MMQSTPVRRKLFAGGSNQRNKSGKLSLTRVILLAVFVMLLSYVVAFFVLVRQSPAVPSAQSQFASNIRRYSAQDSSSAKAMHQEMHQELRQPPQLDAHHDDGSQEHHFVEHHTGHSDDNDHIQHRAAPNDNAASHDNSPEEDGKARDPLENEPPDTPSDDHPQDVKHDDGAAQHNNAVKDANGEPISIGFAVTVTGCGPDPITEGAAVLKHAIHLVSSHGSGRYDYQMYAIYHPDGERCALPLKQLGYTLLKRDTPVAVKDIQGDFLRENIERNGCCGEKELVKLEAYTLTQHPVVVHLDLDVVILKPMDALFDWMLANDSQAHDTSDVPIMWPDMPKPDQVNAFFTRDYNMVQPFKKYKPCQGGFLALRPDLKVYNEFVDIVREGHFTKGGGWGGKVGPFYGSMTFQGIIPYYYDYLHPNQAVELNRCIYNQMADNPRVGKTINDIVSGKCRTNQDECEDCRSRPLEEVVSAHFTLCQKPWTCTPQDGNIIQQRLCRKLHHQWFRIRSDLEQTWGRSGVGDGKFDSDHFYGHCKGRGKRGYASIQEPFGESL